MSRFLIETSEVLYRYDLIKPPNQWDKEFRNEKYNFCNLGHKNKAGLFFFTNSLDIANDLGKTNVKENGQAKGFYRTKCTPTSPLKIIDFSCSSSIYVMLRILKDLDIDVLNDDFKFYGNFDGDNTTTFSSWRDSFEAAENENNMFRKLKIIQNLKLHPNSNVQDVKLFGQRLTDFDNGIKFKELVISKSNEIDGYRWVEFDNSKGLTYCLFDSGKLSNPEYEFIEI